ncbi:dimethyladenosine transferase 2, mitochondrial [Battus philenor]|uniref:dimethyladenosine transferase 2, mitochondrial n=1 Tax=Battus philenor TaxID=42288 RepID=UPI0035CFEF89
MLFSRIFTIRNNTTVCSLRLWFSTNKHNVDKKGKVATDVMNYLENDAESKKLVKKLPTFLLRKYKTPESMYLINSKTAKEIAKAIKSSLGEDCPIIEVNPGIGFLSKELLQCKNNHIYLYESSNHFSPHIKELQSQYPDRLTYKVADFFGMWKLAFKDKMDGGNRIAELLGDLASNDNSRMTKIVGAMPGLSFVKHLIFNIVFHSDTNQLGRPDLFITMPGHHFKFITDSGQHKSLQALFQMFFDFKILIKVPKVHYLPWTYPSVSKKTSMIDEYCMYLINITQKEKLPCPPEYLPLLWYFFKSHLFSRKTKIIPKLEQWIPGCGVWLITGQDPPDSNKTIGPSENDVSLPHITIFTEFGELSLQQKITLFKRFVSWPEFEQCSFRVTMENNLPKSISHLEDEEKGRFSSHLDEMEISDEENDCNEK